MTRRGHQLPGEYCLQNVECRQQILLTICVFTQSKGTHSILLVSRPTSFARRLKCAPGNQSGMKRTVECIVNHPFANMEKIHTNWGELYPIFSGSGDRRHQMKGFLQKMDERVVIRSYLVSVGNLQYNSHCVPLQNLVNIWSYKHCQWRHSHLRICIAKPSGAFARFWRSVWVSCVWMGR